MEVDPSGRPQIKSFMYSMLRKFDKRCSRLCFRAPPMELVKELLTRFFLSGKIYTKASIITNRN